MLVVGACYLGPAQAQKFLDTFDYDAFCIDCQDSIRAPVKQGFKVASPMG